MSMEKHKISVIIPVYNVDMYIEKCLDSIINQTYKNLEIKFKVSDNILTVCDVSLFPTE